MPTVSETEALYAIDRLSYADYALFPDDGRRHEILDGQHVMSPAPRTAHQRLVGDLFIEIQSYARAHRLGRAYIAPFDVLLEDHAIVQPDVCFVSSVRRAIVDAENCKGAPDLIAEVLSPRTRRRDLVEKRRAYERAGVAEYWIVDPAACTVGVLRLGAGGRFEAPVRLAVEAGDTLETLSMPGFTLALPDLFG